MNISGLGDCGTDPCTWVDNVYVRDACLDYLRCADPNNVLVIGVDQGFGAAVGAGVGQEVGGFFGNVADQTVSTSGVGGTLIMIALAVGGFFVIEGSMKR